MNGVLYIVATPIGNLDDISLRAIATLKAVDLVAAEDTRHSKHLLDHLGIDTRLLSYHQHNEQTRSQEILAKLMAGSDIALISDAGTPLISDPGYHLVSAAQQVGIRVSPVPGANSAIAALCAAGLPTESFHFHGFLSAKSNQRMTQLRRMKDLVGTQVFFESSHRIERLLVQVGEVFPQNHCVVAKELTKLHEQFLRGNADEILARLQAEENLSKGEFVVLVDNPAKPEIKRPNTDDIELLQVLLGKVSVNMAVKIATQLTGKKKNDLYQLALHIQNENKSETAD